MNTIVLIALVATVVVVVALLLWVFLRPSRGRSSAAPMITQAPGAPILAASRKTAKKPPAPKAATGEGPSVEVPKDKSSTRWVGKMIDEHPDEAAAVLRRWIQEK